MIFFENVLRFCCLKTDFSLTFEIVTTMQKDSLLDPLLDPFLALFDPPIDPLLDLFFYFFYLLTYEQNEGDCFNNQYNNELAKKQNLS